MFNFLQYLISQMQRHQHTGVDGSASGIAAANVNTGTFGGSGDSIFPGIIAANGSTGHGIENVTLSLDAAGGANDERQLSAIAAPYAFVVCAETASSGAVALFFVAGGTGNVYEVFDPAAAWAPTTGGDDYCIYWTGSAYNVQNNTAGARTVNATLIGISNY